MIKCVVFDWYGVCTKEPWRIIFCRELGTKLDLPPDLVSQSFRKFVVDYELGLINGKQFLGLVLADLQHGEDMERFSYVIEMQPEIDWDVVHLVQQIKRRYRVLLFSNNYKEAVQHIRRSLNPMENYFDACLFSSDAGIIKADMKIYDLLLAQAQAAAAEIVFIDDQEKNLRRAATIGINTILYQGCAKLLGTLKELEVQF